MSRAHTPRWYRWFTVFIACILAVGILPSFTALSTSLYSDFPNASKYFGPLNVLKLYAPFVLFFLWRERRVYSKKFWTIYGALLGLGTVCSLIAWIPCGFPSSEIRDWGVIALGTLYSLAFLALPKRHLHAVLTTWTILVGGTALLQLIWPASIDWLYGHIFDPQTPLIDLEQTRTRALSGVFSRQSLAKLLSWIPWLALAYSLTPKSKGWVTLAAGVLCIFATGAILGTTQRGPFLAGIAAWLVFTAHQSFRVRDHAIALVGAASVAISLLLMALIVPTDLIRERFAFVGRIGQTRYIDPSLVFRSRVTRIALDQIKKRPLGNACISKDIYEDYSVNVGHSHNLFLQQFVARGWIWGLVHFFLWFAALVGAWRLRTSYGSALAAGLVTVILGGMVDHPWFPLNHAMVLGVLLTLGLSTWVKQRPLRV